LWLPSSRVPPSGVCSRCLIATSGSVVSSPSSSSAQPAGIGLFQRLAMRSLPKATVVVAMSRTNGACRPAGAANDSGFVEIFASRPNVGTMATNGELVVATPIMSCASAIIE